jgi:hypothetical protein
MKLPVLLLCILQLTATPCAAADACTWFEPDAGPVAQSTRILSDRAREIRDFALFAHRKIGADIIERQGLYLETLLDALPACADRNKKITWLTRLLIEAPDTGQFADRIARLIDAANPAPPATAPAP